MIKRRWPSNMEYVAAVGDLSWCFADPELKNGYILESATPNVPELATGQNAIVFPVHCGDDVWAVRCFTTAADDCQRRYEALANYTAGIVCRPLVEAEWLE